MIAISFTNAQIHENLNRAEEKYRSIFENAVEGIYQSTLAGKRETLAKSNCYFEIVQVSLQI